MKKNHQSYRDRYFSEYHVIRVPANNRKGYRTEYRYIGLWKSWENAFRGKWQLGWLEVLSLSLYIACAMVKSPINYAHLASGFGVLTVVAWLVELIGILHFLFSHQYVQELSWKEIDGLIHYGCCTRGGMTLLTGLTGIGSVVWDRTVEQLDWIILGGLLISGVLAFKMWKLYSNLLVATYQNCNGKPGNRI